MPFIEIWVLLEHHSSRELYVMVMCSINILSCSEQKWICEAEMAITEIQQHKEMNPEESNGFKPGLKIYRLMICLTTCKSALYRHCLAHMDRRLDFTLMHLSICIIFLFLWLCSVMVNFLFFICFFPPVLIYFSIHLFRIFMLTYWFVGKIHNHCYCS